MLAPVEPWPGAQRIIRITGSVGLRMLLERINEPADLRGLSSSELADLAGEIRDFIVDAVSKSSGHLGSNLGAVELSLALHRVFDSPTDAILWDTGHQAYVHKIVTGRRDRFDELRQAGGLVGISESRGERPRLHREQPRVDGALVRVRDGRGACRRNRQAPPHRRRDRRRCDDRWDRLRGAQQPRSQPPSGDHRAQRQRPQLRPDRVEPLRQLPVARPARGPPEPQPVGSASDWRAR